MTLRYRIREWGDIQFRLVQAGLKTIPDGSVLKYNSKAPTYVHVVFEVDADAVLFSLKWT